MDDIGEGMLQEGGDVATVVEDFRDKMKFFMRHQMTFSIQNFITDAEHPYLMQKEEETKAVVLLHKN